jgi:hypothetical protein
VPVELIIREFGKPVADIVMEVTDDKNLPKEERKHRQIQAALKKSREAKLIKTKKSDSQIQCPLLGDERTRRGRRGTDAIDQSGLTFRFAPTNENRGN